MADPRFFAGFKKSDTPKSDGAKRVPPEISDFKSKIFGNKGERKVSANKENVPFKVREVCNPSTIDLVVELIDISSNPNLKKIIVYTVQQGIVTSIEKRPLDIQSLAHADGVRGKIILGGLNTGKKENVNLLSEHGVKAELFTLAHEIAHCIDDANVQKDVDGFNFCIEQFKRSTGEQVSLNPQTFKNTYKDNESVLREDRADLIAVFICLGYDKMREYYIKKYPVMGEFIVNATYNYLKPILPGLV